MGSPAQWTPVLDDASSAWKPVADSPAAGESFGQGLYNSTIGGIKQTFTHPIDTIEAGLSQLLHVQDVKHAVDLIKNGKTGEAAAHIAKAVMEGPLSGAAHGISDPIVSDLQSGSYGGAGGRALGSVLMLAPALVGDELPAYASAAKAAVKAGGADAAAAGTMMLGAEAVSQIPGMAWPARFGMAYPAGRALVKAGQKGYAAAAEAIRESRFAKAYPDYAGPQVETVPADQMPIAPRNAAEAPSAPGAPAPITAADVARMTPAKFAKQPADMQAAAQATADALNRQAAAQADRAASPPPAETPPAAAPPAGIPGVLPAPGTPAGPIRPPLAAPPAAPVAPPAGPAPEVPPAPAVQPQTTVAPAPPIPTRTLAQIEAAMAQKGPPPVESPQSPYNATGERLSSDARGEIIHADNATKMAQRFADQFSEISPKTGEPYLTVSEVRKIIGNDANWQQLADAMGEKVPSVATRTKIVDAMNQMQGKAAKPLAPPPDQAPAPYVPSGPLANNPRALEIAKQLQAMMEEEQATPRATASPVVKK